MSGQLQPRALVTAALPPQTWHSPPKPHAKARPRAAGDSRAQSGLLQKVALIAVESKLSDLILSRRHAIQNSLQIRPKAAWLLQANGLWLAQWEADILVPNSQVVLCCSSTFMI